MADDDLVVRGGADGYEATIVSGKVTLRAGVATDVLSGRLMRGPRAALA